MVGTPHIISSINKGKIEERQLYRTEMVRLIGREKSLVAWNG